MTRSRDDDDWDDDDRPRRKSRRARDEDDDDDRPHSTQKKKRKSGGLSPLVWIGAGGGALVLIVVIIVLVVVLIPSQPRITEENIQKIKIGMSQKDVEKIFGAPGKVVIKSQMRLGGKEVEIRPLGRFQGSSLPMELYGRQSCGGLLTRCSLPAHSASCIQVRRPASGPDLLLRQFPCSARYPLRSTANNNLGFRVALVQSR